MKKAYKVLSVLMIVLMIAFACTNVFAAVDPDSIKSDEPLGAADTQIATIGSKILSVVTSVGIVLAIVVIAVLGVKYMMGSLEEKAEYKKTMIPYLVGAILVFGASAIGKVVINMGQSFLG